MIEQETLFDMTPDENTGTIEQTEIEYLFIPIKYYNLAGQIINPDKTGIYIASDGYIRKLIYITKK